MIYIDDILIHALNKQEHDVILNKASNLAKKYYIKFKKDKWNFGKNKIK